MLVLKKREAWIDWSKTILILINIFEIWGRYLSNTTLSSLVYTVLVMIMCYYPIKWSMKKAPWLLGK